MADRLADIPPEMKVFVDSNILLYSLSKKSKYYQDCRRFMSRIADGEIFGFVNPFVMSEVLFRNIVASVIGECHPKDPIQFIKRHPDVLKERKLIYEKTLHILDLNLTMLSTDRETWVKAVALSTEYSLLPNDSIHAATCNTYGIEHVATNDSDFERVSFLCIWKPEEAGKYEKEEQKNK